MTSLLSQGARCHLVLPGAIALAKPCGACSVRNEQRTHGGTQRNNIISFPLNDVVYLRWRMAELSCKLPCSLGDLPLSKEAGWRDKIETPEPMELERRLSADENCHHDANIDAPPSQGSKGPKVVVASPAVFVQQELTAAATSRAHQSCCVASDGPCWRSTECSSRQHVALHHPKLCMQTVSYVRACSLIMQH